MSQSLNPKYPAISRDVLPITLIVAALMCFLLMIGYFLQVSYQNALVAGVNETYNLVGVIESRLSSEFLHVDGILDFVTHEVQSESFPSPSATVTALQTQHLVRLVASAPELAGLFVFDAQGILQMASDPGVKPFSIAEHAHFQTLRDHPQIGLIFSESFLSRTTGQGSLTQSRPIRDGAGRFLGVVNAVFHINVFSDMFRNTSIGQRDGVISLRRSDNYQLVTRIPRYNGNDMDQSIAADHPVRKHLESGIRQGTLTYTSSIDGVRRVACLSRLDDRFPFYVQVAFSVDRYLAAWRQQVLWMVLLVVPLLLAFALALVRLTQSNRRAEVASKQLEYRQALFGALFEQSAFFAAVLDADGQMLEVNDRALAAIGRQRDEVTNRYFPDTPWWTDSPDRSRLQDSIQAAQTGECATFEAMQPMASQSKIAVMVHIQPVRVGDVCYIAVTGMNITERKQAELMLQSESEKNKALLHNASDGITITDENANVVEVSDSFCSMLGYTRDEMIGMNVTHWDCGFNGQDDLMAAFSHNFQSPTRSLFQSRHRRKNGSIYDVEINIQTIDLEGHRLLFSSHRDVTDRVKAKKLLAEQFTALKHSEAQMATSQRIGGIGSCVYDFNTDRIWASTQMLNIFGFPTDITDTADGPLDYALDDFLACVPTKRDRVRETLAGKFGFPCDIADYPLDDFLADIPEHDPVRQTLKDLINQSHEYDGEFSIQPADGSNPRVIHAIGKLERDRHGTPVKILGFVQDVTNRRKTEADLREAKLAADAANVTKSQFLATMSHEIRTPMNGILGMAQLLLMPNSTDNDRHEYAKTILSSGQTLLALLNDILDLSKIEAGKFQLDSLVFDPDSLLRETQLLFSGTAHAKALQLAYQWHGKTDSRYLSDAIRIRQMLSNLVGNAIKFTRDGCVRIEGMAVEQGGESALLQFSVSDTGIGIPPDKMDLLFKPFSQTDGSITREFGGSGLGLSIVRHLAHMMGGDVGVESVAGEGSRFWFSLQAKLVEHNEPYSGPQPGVSANAASNPEQLSGRVLVVEDNVVNRMVIESLLTKLGVCVTVAHDGQQAVEALIQGDSPDLVLMDLHMPILDGYGATEQIRQWERSDNRPRLPIIALTADAYEEDRQHCLAVGMDGFLAKPIALDALKSALCKWLPTFQS